ncbi:site-specific integrase [uncultured Parabacteroides sp.]|uniref:tyrosine-type recombinase/integrase n=1 Tax=uncultured Parabacteroides sp. TaxID=512312 RepID=UPI0028040A19|nr:site-specific integrase [uncultured Parabacteroides sp.]
MKNKINFTLEKRKNRENSGVNTTDVPVLAVISYPGQRIKYPIGYRVSASDWMEEGQVQPFFVTDNGVNADEVNALIAKIKCEINSYFAYCDAVHSEPSKAEILNKLRLLTGRKEKAIKRLAKRQIKPAETRSFLDYINEHQLFKNFSYDRKKGYRSAFKHLFRFCKAYGITANFDTITTQVLENFRKYLTDGKHCKPVSKNTVSYILTAVKSFWRYCIKMGYTNNNPFLRFEIEPEVYGQPIYITKEERDTLYYLHIPDERLRKTRDIFVFQCLVGCRVGDLIRLKKENVVNGAIEYIPRKTKDERPVIARVPLCPKAQSIIDRYTTVEDEKLLPFISPQKYNDYIKELFRFAHITRTVTRLNPLTRQEERVSIADVASSHMARRTFIGILHRKVKNEVIGSMSGHSANSKAFSRYYHIEDDTKRDAVNTYLD